MQTNKYYLQYTQLDSGCNYIQILVYQIMAVTLQLHSISVKGSIVIIVEENNNLLDYT